jgi:ribonuclease HI
MEITAALEALRTLTPDASDVEVVSDSTYVVNCFKDRWWQGWQRRNWKNSQNKPVANRDLWEPLIELAVSSEARRHLALGQGALG